MKPNADFIPQPAKRVLSYRFMMMIGLSVAFALFALSYGLVFEFGLNNDGLVNLPDENLPLGSIIPGELLALSVFGSEYGETAIIDASVSNQISADVCVGGLELDDGLRLELKYAGGVAVSEASCSFDAAIIMLNNESMQLIIDSSHLTAGLRFSVRLQFSLDSPQGEALFDCGLYNGNSDSKILADQITVRAKTQSPQ